MALVFEGRGTRMYTHEGPRLWLADDGVTVVPDGDPRAATLLIAPGQAMSDDDARRYGLLSPAKAAPKPNKAEAGPAQNKAEGPKATK